MSQVKATKTPKSTVPTHDQIIKAGNEHKYLRVGGNGGSLVLSGAKRMFGANPGFTYLPGSRLAGFPDDLEKVLRDMKMEEADIDEQFAIGYAMVPGEDGKPVLSNSAEFEAELAELKAFQGKDKPVKEKVTLETMTTSKPKKTAEKSTTGRAKGDLSERLSALAEGKALDVSAMKPDGSGARSVQMPKTTTKFTVRGHNLIGADYDILKSALALAGIAYYDGIIIEGTRKKSATSKAPKAEPKGAEIRPTSPPTISNLTVEDVSIPIVAPVIPVVARPGSPLRLGSPSRLPAIPTVPSIPMGNLPKLPSFAPRV